VVIVVPQYGEDRRINLADHVGEVVEVDLAMADEVPADDYEVGFGCIGHRDGIVLDGHRGHATHVQVGQVRDPNPFEMLEKTLRTCKPTDAKPARGIVPRVSLTQKRLSKLPEPLDGGGSAHV
jgi:hypothetical protein